MPMLPAQYVGELPKGKPLPDRVVYVTGGGLVPHIPSDPAVGHPVTVHTPMGRQRFGKLPNGLSPRADCMARLIARGVSGVDAMRAAYGAVGSPKRLADRASAIVTGEVFREEVTRYRQSAERERAQEAIGMRDFVLSRLTLEAQTAKQDAARIQALKLLGQSEAMWTTVQRTEKAIDPKDLQALKAQLEQRLRHALHRLVPGSEAALSQGLGTEDGPETGLPGPHPGTTILVPNGSHASHGYSNPQVPSPQIHTGGHREMEAGDFCQEGPDQFSMGGPRQMEWGDL